MATFNEAQISRAIANACHEKPSYRIVRDVLGMGAGPAGLVAGFYLVRGGHEVILVKKRLSSTGGTWGGGMRMDESVLTTTRRRRAFLYVPAGLGGPQSVSAPIVKVR